MYTTPLPPHQPGVLLAVALVWAGMGVACLVMAIQMRREPDARGPRGSAAIGWMLLVMGTALSITAYTWSGMFPATGDPAAVQDLIVYPMLWSALIGAACIITPWRRALAYTYAAARHTHC